jgi:hypothetical protein
MNRAENRASALGKRFQRLFIANGDVASINLNQSVCYDRDSARDTTSGAEPMRAPCRANSIFDRIGDGFFQASDFDS